MEHRFDNLSKRMAEGVTRRTLLRRFGGGGVAGAMLASMGVKTAAAQAGDSLCLRAFEIAVRQGPSAGLTVNGVLGLSVDASGNISRGAFALRRGKTVAKVTGQVLGRAINLVFDLGNGNLLFGNGTLETDIRTCSGAMRGPVVGPKRADLGDWSECCCPDFDATCGSTTTPVCLDCGGSADVDYCSACLGACSGFGGSNCLRLHCQSFC